MTDAVNSSLVSAQLLRVTAEQASSSSRSVEQAAPVRPVAQAPKAPYVSPYISVDFNYDRAVLQIRDSETGDVQEQFPTESRMAQIRQAQAQLEASGLQRSAELPDAPQERSSSEPAARAQAAPQGQATDIVTVQEVTSAAPSNQSAPPAHVAAQALSAASAPSAGSSQVSVLA